MNYKALLTVGALLATPAAAQEKPVPLYKNPGFAAAIATTDACLNRHGDLDIRRRQWSSGSTPAGYTTLGEKKSPLGNGYEERERIFVSRDPFANKYLWGDPNLWRAEVMVTGEAAKPLEPSDFDKSVLKYVSEVPKNADGKTDFKTAAKGLNEARDAKANPVHWSAESAALILKTYGQKGHTRYSFDAQGAGRAEHVIPSIVGGFQLDNAGKIVALPNTLPPDKAKALAETAYTVMKCQGQGGLEALIPEDPVSKGAPGTKAPAATHG